MSYQAPLQDIWFALRHNGAWDRVTALPAFAEVDADTAQAVLEESARFCGEVIAPLNATSDRQGAVWRDGEVVTSPGFREAYAQYVQGGWLGLTHAAEHGGQGLPRGLGVACEEMLQSACLAFSLCPLLTSGALEALLLVGDARLKQDYLDKLMSGVWAGTMNLTEPQAGSDLALIRSKAVRQADGSYRVSGQKIFITFGEHDLTDNIVHLVLARTPDAPEGVKGISLFIVPKRLPDGRRNDVVCSGLEHKLGIHGSPTAVLLFGAGKGEVNSAGEAQPAGAVGWLLGEENRGLEYMFIMMNAARFSVGLQGVSLGERALQQALTYASERVQSRDLRGSKQAVTINHHPDVKRMLLTMRGLTEASRALAHFAAGQLDLARQGAQASQDAGLSQAARQHFACYEFLIPVFKGFATETALEVATLGIQVHGGMGYIEETGAAQYLRDARILSIYEGTTAIQANDLVGRKTLRDQGAVVKALLAEVTSTATELESLGTPQAQAAGAALREAEQATQAVVTYVLQHAKPSPEWVFAGAVPYLMLCGYTLSAWQLARQWLAAARAGVGQADAQTDAAFLARKQRTAQHYLLAVLPRVQGLAAAVLQGGETIASAPAEAL